MSQNRYVYIFATLDTKGVEAAYLRGRLRDLGVSSRLVDTGCLGEPAVAADISRQELFSAQGSSLGELVAAADRGRAVTAAAAASAALAAKHFGQGLIVGILGLGGSAGTTIGTAAMQALPLGIPKVMVSTLASGQVRQFVGNKDIFMLNSVVDIAGLNRISRPLLDAAARAMAGLVTLPVDRTPLENRPLIAATMFGVTTPCVERARQVLTAAGCEVIVFHATGSGGQTLESLIREGVFAGVLDLTTTELADELVGGFLSAGPGRLTAAAALGVPQVVSVGATDMVNFHGPETVPPQFAGRQFYRHNPHVTLMRTTAAENRQIGAEIGRKVAASRGPACILLPTRGVSALDRAGQPFDNTPARQALAASVREQAGGVEVTELDWHINDPQFAEFAAHRLLSLMQRG